MLLIKEINQPKIAIGQEVYAGTMGKARVVGIRLDPSGKWEYLVRVGDRVDEELYYSLKEMILLGVAAPHVFEERWEIEAKCLDGEFIYQVLDRETGLRSASLKLFATADDAAIAAVKMLQREFWDFFGLDNPGR